MEIYIANDGFKMGGAERVTIEIANSFKRKGNDVSIIDLNGEEIIFYEVDKGVNILPVIKKRILKRKITWRLLNYKYLLDKKPLKVSALYKEQIENLVEFLKSHPPDILIISQRNTAFIPQIKKEIPQIKLIAWQHNEYEIYMEKYYKFIIEDYKSGLREADSVVCLTEADQKKFVEWNEKSICIPNPVTLTNADHLVSDLSNKNIIFVGRLKIDAKGLDYVMDIGKNLPIGWKVLIAGDGPDRNKLEKMIKKNKLENRIILKGLLNNEELTELYLSGAIFISTSRWEGFGLVITEAMLFGLPIISFGNRGPEEILKNGEYGVLVKKHDLIDFKRKLNELIELPDERINYQKKSLERVEQYKMATVMERWEELLEDLLD